MQGMIIRDGAVRGGGGSLAFDLADVLRAVGPGAAASTWRCRGVWYTGKVGHDSIPALDAASDDWAEMSGAALAEAAEQVVQVIDGEFEARRVGETEPWLVARAVDSSWWEVFSRDAATLASLRRVFRDVEDVPAGAV